MFKGSLTALITPFTDSAAKDIDWSALERLIRFQLDSGTHGLVPCGTTGESPTLSHVEHRDVIERTLAIVAGQVPVIAGTGSNSTHEAIDLTLHAQKAGAAGALIVTPYYNKPTQEGLYAHYKAIHDATDIPIIIYNIPGRCVIDLKVDTLARLHADCTRIVGLKDATGDLARPTAVRAACGDNFIQLSGNDDTAPAFLAQGGHGCISVVANVLPRQSAALHNAWVSRDMPAFFAARDALAPLSSALFMETSPAPVKYVAAKMGLCQEILRLPLVPISPATRERLDRLI